MWFQMLFGTKSIEKGEGVGNCSYWAPAHHKVLYNSQKSSYLGQRTICNKEDRKTKHHKDHVQKLLNKSSKNIW